VGGTLQEVKSVSAFLSMLKEFGDENFMCKFYKFITPNQEQLQKMQL
jgi:hypothetical protein